MAIKMFAVRAVSGKEFTKVFKDGPEYLKYVRGEGAKIEVKKLRNVAPFPPKRPYSTVIDDGYV